MWDAFNRGYVSMLKHHHLRGRLNWQEWRCTESCEDAALHGQLEVLRWLRKNGCP